MLNLHTKFMEIFTNVEKDYRNEVQHFFAEVQLNRNLANIEFVKDYCNSACHKSLECEYESTPFMEKFLKKLMFEAIDTYCHKGYGGNTVFQNKTFGQAYLNVIGMILLNHINYLD